MPTTWLLSIQQAIVRHCISSSHISKNHRKYPVGIPNVSSNLDDILIMGKTKEH